MTPLLLAFELDLRPAHSQASQILVSHAGSTAETIRASGNGAIFNHAKFWQSRTHRESMLGLTRNNKNIIVESGPCIALHEAPLEFKLWQ